MKGTTSKILNVIRNHPSGIRIQFDNKNFETGQIITNNKLYGQQFYISERVKDIYTLTLITSNKEESVDFKCFREGVEFMAVPIFFGIKEETKEEPTRSILD